MTMSKILMYMKDWLDAQPETEQEWIGKLEELKATERRAGWEFARWLQWGVRQYSRAVDDIAAQVGYSPHTLANILSAMNNTAAPLAQELGLNLSHAVEVLGLPEEEKAMLLTVAAESSWSPSRLRYQVNQQRLTSLITAGNAIGSAPLNDNAPNVETYQGEDKSTIVPVCYVCRERNATLFAADGRLLCAECHTATVPISGIEMRAGAARWVDDDVPFSEPSDDSKFLATASAIEILDHLEQVRGKKFVAEIKEEVCRWW